MIIVVEGTRIALLAEGGVNDAITAAREAAVGAARVRLVSIPFTKVAFLIRINDTIRATGELAVRTAGISRVTIGNTIIAVLTIIFHTVAAFGLALLVAAVTVLVVGIITLLTVVSNAITAIGKHAVSTAVVSPRKVPRAIITLLSTVNNAITAHGEVAVGTAGVGLEIVVHLTVITLFRRTTKNGFNLAVTASLLSELGKIEPEVVEELRASVASIVENSNRGPVGTKSVVELNFEVV